MRHNHLPLTFERLEGDPDHIENDGFSANMRRILRALRHAATTANRLGNHRGPDANADLLARHAAHTLTYHAAIFNTPSKQPLARTAG